MKLDDYLARIGFAGDYRQLFPRCIHSLQRPQRHMQTVIPLSHNKRITQDTTAMQHKLLPRKAGPIIIPQTELGLAILNCRMLQRIR